MLTVHSIGAIDADAFVAGAMFQYIIEETEYIINIVRVIERNESSRNDDYWHFVIKKALKATKDWCAAATNARTPEFSDAARSAATAARFLENAAQAALQSENHIRAIALLYGTITVSPVIVFDAATTTHKAAETAYSYEAAAHAAFDAAFSHVRRDPISATTWRIDATEYAAKAAAQAIATTSAAIVANGHVRYAALRIHADYDASVGFPDHIIDHDASVNKYKSTVAWNAYITSVRVAKRATNAKTVAALNRELEALWATFVAADAAYIAEIA